MIKYITGADEAVVSFVSSVLQEGVPGANVTTIAVIKDNMLIGGVVFHDYNGSNIEMTIAGPGAMTRTAIAYVFDYVFTQLGCNRLSVRVKRSNKRVLKMANKMGFTYEATLKQFFGPDKSDDAILFRMDFLTATRWM